MIVDRQLPEDVIVREVPFIINVGDRDFVDTPDLDVPEMLQAMEDCTEASRTSCPSPDTWYQIFKEADNIIAITISANLSGSYNSAITAREMALQKNPDKKIYVLNSRSAGSVLAMYAELCLDMIAEGKEFDQIVADVEAFAKERNTVFALASFSNLVKNGRVSKLSGFIAGKLGIWGIGVASEIGTIIVKAKTRGLGRVLSAFITDMKENGFNGGYVIISHCQNLELATKLKERIHELWENTKVKILATGGLCSYYAERQGMIVAY
jgi:DegV family protein with EDD domain